MFFYPPFNLPFLNNYKYPNNKFNKNSILNNSSIDSGPSINMTINSKNSNEKASQDFKDSEAFFEIFGLKLYLDDILILCILFFLYTEKVKDDELFICLILLLLS